MFKGDVKADSIPRAAPESDESRRERERLEAVMAQRIEEQRKKKAEEEAQKSMFKRPGAAVPSSDSSSAASSQDNKSPFVNARAEKYLERDIVPENSPFYQNNQSNEKYVKYHDPSYRDMVWNGPYKRPPHPRQRHRCDYHLEDFLETMFDKKVGRWDALKTYVSCLRSNPGEEPPRLRKEVWRL